MRLLRFFKFARVALVLIALAGMGWLAFSAFSVMRRPEWAFNADEAQSVQNRMGNLTTERQRLEYWNNMLDDRSKAWTSMENLTRLFPANSGLLLKNFNHTVRPDSAPGQKKVGFVKEWTISGMARDEALSYLNTLNTREGISAHFAEISKLTGNSAYDPTPTTRNLVVNVKTLENSGFRQVPLEEVMLDGATKTFSNNVGYLHSKFYIAPETTQTPAAADPVLAIEKVQITAAAPEPGEPDRADQRLGSR